MIINTLKGPEIDITVPGFFKRSISYCGNFINLLKIPLNEFRKLITQPTLKGYQ